MILQDYKVYYPANKFLEMAFITENLCVFSNAKNFRLDTLTPLVVPTVNLSHVSDMLSHQSLGKADALYSLMRSRTSRNTTSLTKASWFATPIVLL